MKDIIWTIIIIWLVFRLIAVIKSFGKKRAFNSGSPDVHNDGFSSPSGSEKDLKSARQKHLNKEGEYVDFEEIK
jgi:hypothetical protein